MQPDRSSKDTLFLLVKSRFIFKTGLCFCRTITIKNKLELLLINHYQLLLFSVAFSRYPLYLLFRFAPQKDAVSIGARR